jgi:hypothetical protein
MRQMQGIARLGWEDYVRLYLNRNEQTQQVNQANQANQANQSNPTQLPNSNKPVISDEPIYSILENEDSKQICPICLEYLVIEKSNVYVLSNGKFDGTKSNPVECGHKYHIECIREWVNGIYKKNNCPICRTEIKIIAPLSK